MNPSVRNKGLNENVPEEEGKVGSVGAENVTTDFGTSAAKPPNVRKYYQLNFYLLLYCLFVFWDVWAGLQRHMRGCYQSWLVPTVNFNCGW